MLDILGAMMLTTFAATLVAVLILAGPPVQRSRLVLGAGAWFAGIATLAAFGVFALPVLGTAAVGAAVATPVIAGLIAGARSRPLREFALGIPLAVLVVVHVGRLLGALFVALHAAGRLPPTFALTAGWGDVLVAALAAPMAWAIHRRAAGWRPLALGWNTLGLLDLVVAASLGVGSADSPLRFIHEQPDSSAVAMLPWVMIPGFFVPLYMLTHLAIFARIAIGAREEHHAWGSRLEVLNG